MTERKYKIIAKMKPSVDFLPDLSPVTLVLWFLFSFSNADGIILYDQINEQGQALTVVIESPCYNVPAEWNDQAASLNTQSCIILYEHWDCLGEAVAIRSPSSTNLVDVYMDDRLTSIRLCDASTENVLSTLCDDSPTETPTTETSTPTPTAETSTPTPTAETTTPTPTAETSTPTPTAENSTPTPTTETSLTQVTLTTGTSSSVTTSNPIHYIPFCLRPFKKLCYVCKYGKCKFKWIN